MLKRYTSTTNPVLLPLPYALLHSPPPKRTRTATLEHGSPTVPPEDTARHRDTDVHHTVAYRAVHRSNANDPAGPRDPRSHYDPAAGHPTLPVRGTDDVKRQRWGPPWTGGGDETHRPY